MNAEDDRARAAPPRQPDRARAAPRTEDPISPRGCAAAPHPRRLGAHPGRPGGARRAEGLVDVAVRAPRHRRWGRSDRRHRRGAGAGRPAGRGRGRGPGRPRPARLAAGAARAARLAHPARRQLDEYFAGRRRDFDVALDWRLTRGLPPRGAGGDGADPLRPHRLVPEVATRGGQPGRRPRGRHRARHQPAADPGAVPPRAARRAAPSAPYRGGPEAKARLLDLESA